MTSEGRQCKWKTATSFENETGIDSVTAPDLAARQRSEDSSMPSQLALTVLNSFTLYRSGTGDGHQSP